MQYRPSATGFTLIETLVAAAIFAVLALAVYQGYTTVLLVSSSSRATIAATLLANEEMEILRNLPYTEVGTVGGTPAGVVPASATITRDGSLFQVTRIIQSVDDPFDGLAPGDTKPADYKRVGVSISCAACKNFSTLFFTTLIAPKNIEP
ncbi:MAG: hypothetical protein A2542_01125 [Parcubacteria group bacterium RIFOXYD2_FULL_52_8]|nr:MAG: hypothetical protein A2542_01125 [Parcubacteria group bacterium RIFOXYD2_FULL_52_8]